MEHITLLLFFIGFLCRAQGTPECQDRVVAVDGDLSLQLEKPPREWVKFSWRVRMDGAQGQQTILEVEKNKPSFPKGSFAGRATFQQDTLSLRISPVRETDSGRYWAEFEGSSGRVVIPQCFCVSVWEPVKLPRLETRILHQDNGWCNISLACAATSAGNVFYDWSCTGDALGAPEHHPQLQVRVSEATDPPTVCSCNVSNPVSWSTASTDVTALCPAAASGVSWSYCRVRVLLSILVLGSLGTAVAITQGLIRRRGPPPHSTPSPASTDPLRTGASEAAASPHPASCTRSDPNTP